MCIWLTKDLLHVHSDMSQLPLWQHHILHILEQWLGCGSQWQDSELSRYHLCYDPNFLACCSFMIHTSSPCPPPYEMPCSWLNTLLVTQSPPKLLLSSQLAIDAGVLVRHAVPIMLPGATMSSVEIGLPGCPDFYNSCSCCVRLLAITGIGWCSSSVVVLMVRCGWWMDVNKSLDGERHQ